MDDDQVSRGVWYFTVASTPDPVVGYTWSRVVNGQRIETFASASSSALYFTADTNLELVSATQSFSSRAAFLAWACNELEAEGLSWWEYTSDVEEGTWSCGSTSTGPAS